MIVLALWAEPLLALVGVEPATCSARARRWCEAMAIAFPAQFSSPLPPISSRGSAGRGG